MVMGIYSAPFVKTVLRGFSCVRRGVFALVSKQPRHRVLHLLLFREKHPLALLNKFIRSIGGIHRTFLQFVAAILVLTPYVLATGGLDLRGLGAAGWVSLLIVGLVHTGVTYCMYFSALKELPGRTTALLSYIDPLVAVVISVTLLREGLTVRQGIGGALILGFTLLDELPQRRKKA